MNPRAALSKLAASIEGGGETRDGQIVMAEAVARAVREERPLVVQAGTGTGKTWAYLVGALLTGGGERRILIATATKALQDQLAGKDLPAVAAAGVRPGLTWAVLKGRSNYLCRQAALEAGRQSDTPSLPLAAGPGGPDNRGIGAEVAQLLKWAQDTGTGDRSELDVEPRAAAWSSVSVGSEECPGAQACPSGSTCFAEAAYERARAADVIIVNLHLLGAHVASGGFILPEHDVVVIDFTTRPVRVRHVGPPRQKPCGVRSWRHVWHRGLACRIRSAERPSRPMCQPSRGATVLRHPRRGGSNRPPSS